MDTKNEIALTNDNESRKSIFLEELSNHIKFTILAVFIAAILIILSKRILFSSYSGSTAFSEDLFEGFFISHLFFASLTPAALFSIYKRNLWIGLLLSIATSSITCTLSDIIFPYLGGLVLNYDMKFHVCIYEEPVLAWSFIISGAIMGYIISQYVRKISIYTHSAHILISSLAAGLYLVSFGVGFLSVKALLFIPILIVSVLIPCVMNDIGVPTLIVGASAKSEDKGKILEELHTEHHGHKH
jgi:hypothetical protein